MRKASILLVSLVLAGAALPVAAGPGAGAGAEQFGFIDWIEMNGSEGTLIGVIADRYVDPDGALVTVAAVLRGTCQKERTKDWVLIACEGSGRGKVIPHEDFSVDPTLASASLELRAGGLRHRARWTGRGAAPISGAGVGAGGNWVQAGAGMYRDAKGTGRVYGRRLQTNSWLDWAFLEQGAGAGVYLSDGLEVTRRQGTYFVEKTVRRAR